MVPWLDPRLPVNFPDTSEALETPNGLLAAGGQFSTEWLVKSYSQGIFPWFNEGEPKTIKTTHTDVYLHA